jgi:hypothetical protein
MLTLCLCSSSNDVALIIKYIFDDEDLDLESPIKKRKISDSKLKSVLEYSQIKLPAKMFLKYLETFSSQFLQECIRYCGFLPFLYSLTITSCTKSPFFALITFLLFLALKIHLLNLHSNHESSVVRHRSTFSACVCYRYFFS